MTTSDTITTTTKNLSVVGSGPMWAPVQTDYKGHSPLRSSHILTNQNGQTETKLN